MQLVLQHCYDKLNSDIARQYHQQKAGCFLTGLNVSGETRNIAFQLVLKQCCKTSCTFLLPVLLKVKILNHVFINMN